MFDLVIKNGTVYNGKDKTYSQYDIGIIEDKIQEVGKIEDNVEAKNIIDAYGFVVCPGFIDIHSHIDQYLFVNPHVENKIKQGITTEIGGNCGCSAFPWTKGNLFFKEEYSDFGWNSFGDFLDKLNSEKIAINYASYIGHGSLREYVMGFENRPPTSKEIGIMKKFLSQSMEEGAFGLSTGLAYPPGSFSSTGELIELTKVVGGYGGIYASHIRSEDNSLIEAIQEAIEIAEKADIPVEISHLKTLGKENWFKIDTVLDLIEQANSKGFKVTADRYPYTAGQTILDFILPAWSMDGGKEQLLKNLEEPQLFKRIADAVADRFPDSKAWDDVEISSLVSQKNKQFEGLRITQISEILMMSPFDTVSYLLKEEKCQVEAIYHGMSEDNLRRILKHPAIMLGSDANPIIAHSKEEIPHPRTFGTFPRFIGKYVRDEKVLSLSEAIRKMTSFPSEKIGLKKRGILKKGYYADIVIFDFNRINDRATYQDPFVLSIGIKYVIVNGKLTIEDGEYTGVLAGHILRKEA